MLWDYTGGWKFSRYAYAKALYDRHESMQALQCQSYLHQYTNASAKRQRASGN